MQGQKLEDLLVENNVLARGDVQRLAAGVGPGKRLSDLLVGQQHVGEADLLRLIAKASGVQFISSSRLAGLRVSKDVLDRLPSKAALEHLALPIAWDAPSRTLTIALADVESAAKLEDFPGVGRADNVVIIVALPAAIEFAVRRLYGLLVPVVTAPTPQVVGACPQCKEPVIEEQLECGKCGLLLNPNAPSDRSHVSIVRALLAQPSQVAPAPTRDKVHDAPTRQGYVISVDDGSVPAISGSLDILRRLTDFEAYVVSWVDGALDVGALSEATGLMAIEVRSMVASLAERGVLTLVPPQPAMVTAPVPSMGAGPALTPVARPPRGPDSPLPSATVVLDDDEPAPVAPPSETLTDEDEPLNVQLGPPPEEPAPPFQTMVDEVPAFAPVAGPGALAHAAARAAGEAGVLIGKPVTQSVPAMRPPAKLTPEQLNAPTPPRPKTGARVSLAPELLNAPTPPRPKTGARVALPPAPPPPAPEPPPPAPIQLKGVSLPPPERGESKVAQQAREARHRELLERLGRVARVNDAPAASPQPAEAPVPAVPRADFESENAIQRALAYERRGDIHGAVRVLENAIGKSAQPAPLFNRLAIVILNRHQDAQRAQQLLHRAIELDPENPVYRANLLKVLSHISQ